MTTDLGLKAMVRNRTVRPIMGVLVIIARLATVVALGSRAYFGRLPLFALLGQVVTATGAAPFAPWLKRRR
jgi:hypothetical protein